MSFKYTECHMLIDGHIQVGSRGGPAAIIRAMAAFPSDSELQGEACTAVTNLSHNCDRNRRLVVEDGGLILILNAMQVSKASVPRSFTLLAGD